MTAIAERLARRPLAVAVAAIAVTALLAIPFLTMTPGGTASQEPAGEVFEARDLAGERLAPSTFGSFYIVEAPGGGNILDADALRVLHARARDVRDDPAVSPELLTYFDPATQAQVTGLWTIADRVDAALRDAGLGGLADAADEQVETVAGAVVDEVGPVALGLSQHATRDDATGTWSSPATTLTVLADNDALGGGGGGAQLGIDDTTKEQYARDVQALLRGGEANTGSLRVWGVGIDTNLTSEEQGTAAGPFIGLTIFAVLLLVGVTFRSYWAVAITGAALASLIVWLFGWSNLLGFSEDQILSTIVPIALVSFGVDFAFHAVSRYREERATGKPPLAAVATGLGAVAGALVLALASDAAAFLANVSSGIESIVQFGIAAAIGLASAFVLLGVVTPIVLATVEHHVPRRSGRAPRALAVGGSLLAASVAMTAVLLAVFLAPALGLAVLAGYVVLFVALPAWLGGRRRPDPRPATASRPAIGHSRAASVIGAGMTVVARRWAVVLPITAVVTVAAGIAAVQVPAEFDVRDFFSADTDFVVALDKLDEHVGEQGGEPAVVTVEADLTEPAVVAALDRFADELRTLDSDRFARADDGRIDVDAGVVDLLDDATALPEDVVAATGLPSLTDADGDGMPDARTELSALYAHVLDRGLPFDAGHLAWRPGEVGEVLWTDGTDAMTRMVLGLPGTRAVENINEARADLEPVATALEADLQAVDPDARVVVTGAPIARAASLDAITSSLQTSLPIALVLCLVIAAVFMRSLRFALVSVVPILLVVTWLYALMYWWGFALNLVTATIGAISIGIGIDFAIHLVMRYREELAGSGDRSRALTATGAGTGAALVASAASSIIGFAILAFAPMPLFASYGLLTAVMIALALLATFVVLPPLLWLVTRDAVVPEAVVPEAAVTAGRGRSWRSRVLVR